jgi:predicted RNA-binding Zn ribbon-like protein
MAGSRAATVRLVGGRPSLDLVNTVSWRGDPDRLEDHLQSGPDALLWLCRAGVLTPAEADELAPVAHAVLAGLLEAREAVTPLGDGAGVGPALQAGIRDAVAHSDLGADGWTVIDLDAHAPRRRLLLDAYELVRDPRARVARCADPACGWVFQDVSKGGTRRWCSSADCGNRDRVRRHYERSRA